MRIVLFEDSGSSLYAEDWLRENEYDVWRTMDFRDVMSWVEVSPGIDAFDAWFFDLSVSAKTMKRAEKVELYDESKHHSPSLYFINQYLLKRDSEIKKKIILFSAYFATYDRNNWDLSGFMRVDKTSQQVIDDLYTVLNALNEH